MAVRSSDAGNDSHTPLMPNTAAKSSEQPIMQTNPLITDVTNDSRARSVALKNPAPTILIPANRKPIKYSRIPV